jgi:multidrug efflux pump subunit AcrB
LENLSKRLITPKYKSVALLYGVVLIALFVTSVKLVMPTVGQELMPPMDTGAIAIKITTDANLPITKTQEVMEQIIKLMYDHDKEKLLRVSGSIGSEAGVMSIGSGYLIFGFVWLVGEEK